MERRRLARRPALLISLRLALLSLAACLMAACGTTQRSGGYYQHDGPPPRVPANIDEIPDAMPRVEPLRAANSRPYSTLGRDYVPFTSIRPYKERGLASWYGKQFHGLPTATGEPYDMLAMTAAHTTLPLPCYVRVTNVRNGRSVIVRVNDRGPFHDGRIIDLSYAAAVRLGGPNVGTQEVEVELLLPDEIERLQARGIEPRVAQGIPATTTTATDALRPAALADDMASLITDSASAAGRSPVTTAAVLPVPSLAPLAPLASPDPATPAPTTAANAPVPAPVTEPVPVTAPAGPSVQVGAFAVRSNADAMRDRVVALLPEHAGKVIVALRGNLFRVLVGPFNVASSETVAIVQARLREALGVGSVVVDRR